MECDRPPKRIRLSNGGYRRSSPMPSSSKETKNANQNIVCYGMLNGFRIKFHTSSNGYNASRISVFLDSRNDTQLHSLSSSDRQIQACPDGHTSRIIAHLTQHQDVQLQFDLVPNKQTPSKLSKSLKLKVSSTAEFTLSITLYGPPHLADTIGDYLFEAEEYLQLPLICNLNCPYANPQSLEDPNGSSRMTFDIFSAARLENLEVIEGLKDPSDALEAEEPLPETERPEIVRTPLYSHQKQALSFMLNRERTSSGTDMDEDIWKSVSNNFCEINIYQNTITNEISTQPPQKAKGGILADAMGLGKSLSMISLISSLAVPDYYSSTQDISGMLRARNLLIVPLSLLGTWVHQFETHVKKNRLSWTIYHRTARSYTAEHSLSSYDVVVTTYDVLASQYRRLHERIGPLFKLTWNRVVLDEAHQIREAKSLRAKGAFKLKAISRWAITGTPIQNRLDDLCSLFHFLRIFPDHSVTSLKATLKAVCADDNCKRALLAICLRRSKAAADLPNRVDQIRYVELDERERDFYNKANEATIEMFSRHDFYGSGEPVINYANMLVKINSLRQICNLGTAYQHSHRNNSSREGFDGEKDYLELLLSEILATDCLDCSICGAEVSQLGNAVSSGPLVPSTIHSVSTCGYIVCTNCVIALGQENLSCSHLPQCRSETINDLKGENLQPAQLETSYIPSKIAMLISDILSTPENDKCVVFSMWTSTLQCIEVNLQKAGISMLRIDGSMDRKAREQNIEAFISDETAKVVLFSLHCGANGLNLTAANHVFLMEPQWNPMLEDQAMDRVHRIGQMKEVTTNRYIVKNTFEKHIRNLQEQKRNLVKEVFELSKRKSNWMKEMRELLETDRISNLHD